MIKRSPKTVTKYKTHLWIYRNL